MQTEQQNFIKTRTYSIINSMFLAMFLAIIGCNISNQQAIDRLSDDEKYNLYLEFKNKTIILGGERDTSSIIIKTYDSSTNKVNEYFIVWKDDTTLALLRENLEYGNDASIIDSTTKILKPSIIRAIKQCSALGIKGITSTWKVWGVDLHIMLKSGDVRFYILHSEKIRNDIFLKSKKLSNRWYSYAE